MSERTLEVRLADPEATESLGAALAGLLEPADVVLLVGDLGAGKTTLVRGLAGALSSPDAVTSPTFTLRHEYDTTPRLTHVDCWRLDDAAELADLALDEVLLDGGVLLIEWGELARASFGSESLTVELADADGAEGRVARIWASGGRWEARAGSIAPALQAAGLTWQLLENEGGR